MLIQQHLTWTVFSVFSCWYVLIKSYFNKKMNKHQTVSLNYWKRIGHQSNNKGSYLSICELISKTQTKQANNKVTTRSVYWQSVGLQKVFHSSSMAVMVLRVGSVLLNFKSVCSSIFYIFTFTYDFTKVLYLKNKSISDMFSTSSSTFITRCLGHMFYSINWKN